jgi:hypothetical protein
VTRALDAQCWNIAEVWGEWSGARGVEARDMDGATALMRVVGTPSYHSAISPEVLTQTARKFVEAGADIHATDNAGHNILWYPDILDFWLPFFVEHQVNLDHLTPDGESVMVHLLDNSWDEPTTDKTLLLLLDAGAAHDPDSPAGQLFREHLQIEIPGGARASTLFPHAMRRLEDMDLKTRLDALARALPETAAKPSSPRL